MNTYVVEISNSTPHCWYAGLEGTRFEVYQGRRIYMLKSDYDKNQDDPLSVRGIDLKDCEKVCTTCGHIKSQHRTAGGFCKHCPCEKFTRRRTKRAPDEGHANPSNYCAACPSSGARKPLAGRFTTERNCKYERSF